MPTATPLRRSHRDRSDATRAQLIAAAIRVVREKAFHGASVFEVAKAAGVTPGAFQHHFGTKAELMMQVTESILRGDLDDPLAWPKATASLRRRAEGAVQALWKRVYEPERFLVAWQIYFGSASDDALRERLAAKRAELSQVLHGRFLGTFPELAGQRDGAAFVDTVLSTLRGIAMTRLFGPQQELVDAQLAQLARLIELRCAAAPASNRRKTT
ncbi:TetR/AcrR family transcriptional regulator [Schlegelella sp. S2-27]|uniref:TetR/AcrR family transcriptional regulator n=1 Tax=Caldimonas mangrovi TaxID=2944811 RepID=A0ABT0YMS3_9BURK|nr:TetR/AcrR family transcriptional regulator [Caldimonas mangrovi]MCM5680034.1 TetR/AcrR family transcriptional regulator [Caldimonas mangrovi]